MPGTVTVASKLPHGLVLQLQQEVKVSEPVMGGGVRQTVQSLFAGERKVINGFARPVNPTDDIDLAPTVSGYGLTYGVDKDFFDKWLAQNAEMDAVKNGFIFAHERDQEVKAKARDRKTLLSGFEALKPNDLPGEFKGKIKEATR